MLDREADLDRIGKRQGRMEAAAAFGDDSDDRARRGIEQPRLDQDRVHRRVEERVIGDVVEMAVRVVVVPAGGQRHEAGESGAARGRGARLEAGSLAPLSRRSRAERNGARRSPAPPRAASWPRSPRQTARPRPPRPCRPELGASQAKPAAKIDQMAERHRDQREQPAAHPAALGEPADQRRGEEEADRDSRRSAPTDRQVRRPRRRRPAGRPGLRRDRARPSPRRGGRRTAAPSVSTASVCNVIGTG